MGLQDFQQLQGHLRHLEFKVLEHPNPKDSTLTLKYQLKIKIKLVLLMLLRSKMPIVTGTKLIISDEPSSNLKEP